VLLDVAVEERESGLVGFKVDSGAGRVRDHNRVFDDQDAVADYYRCLSASQHRRP
jgi:hypothetical protein